MIIAVWQHGDNRGEIIERFFIGWKRWVGNWPNRGGGKKGGWRFSFEQWKRNNKGMKCRQCSCKKIMARPFAVCKKITRYLSVEKYRLTWNASNTFSIVSYFRTSLTINQSIFTSPPIDSSFHLVARI